MILFFNLGGCNVYFGRVYTRKQKIEAARSVAGRLKKSKVRTK